MDAGPMERVPDQWTGGIDELVEQANTRLSNVLPDDRAARPKDEINARLVRHYTTQGLLPAPWREGREARYGALHLLNVLALRRLMADGLSGRALYAALDGKDTGHLHDLIRLGSSALQGLTLPPSVSEVEGRNPVSDEGHSALRYLQSLKRKTPLAAQAANAMPLPPEPLPNPPPERKREAHEVAAEAPLMAAPAPAALPAKADAALPDFLLPRKFRQQRTLRSVEVQPGLELQVASDFHWPQDEQTWQELLREVRVVLEEVEQE